MRSSDEKMIDMQPLGKPLPRPASAPMAPQPVNSTGTVLRGPDGRLQTNLPVAGKP